jgi:phosphoribosylamine--glycine ligase
MENNLLDVIQDCMDGKDIELKFKDEKAVCLVMCSGGYPRNIETGFEIVGEDKVKHSKLLYAGAIRKGDKVVSNGGRVLNIVATGATMKMPAKKFTKMQVMYISITASTEKTSESFKII